MIGIFITDIYLMLRYYAGSFYNKYIKYKVNIKLDETEFHQNIPVQKIMIHSDADRRSAFIDLRCNSATAHKLAVLFVKEFELIISKFEDYFKIVGLKLYYLTPKIEKNNIDNAIDNYNFEAYIPTLIPLLTGDNIYARKEVFARELIQNSIDAIAVRRSTDNNFDQTIYITIGQEGERKFFRIKDYGTGMDRYKIERYFTSIGRSFYSGDEYRDLEIDYKPISNFGIGFLSAFMICREIDVKTRYYLDEKEGLKLHIPNYDGCFFIEKDDSLDIGTEITLYIDQKISHDIQPHQIVNYINNTMKDISCNIFIRDQINDTEIILSSKYIRRNISHNNILYIPFLDSGKIEENISIENTIWTDEFIEKYSYGLLVDVSGGNYLGDILNSGIKLYDTDINDLWNMFLHIPEGKAHFNNSFFSFNFPSNYLNIDVSREKITNFTDVVEPDFKIKIMSEISKQIIEYINLSKKIENNNKAIHLHSLMMTIVQLCRSDSDLSRIHNTLLSKRYVLYIRFNENTIDLSVSRSSDKPVDALAYIKNNYIKCFENFMNFISVHIPLDSPEKLDIELLRTKYLKKIQPNIHEIFSRRNLIVEEVSDECYFINYRYPLFQKYNAEMLEYYKKLLKSKEDIMVYTLFLITAFLLQENGEQNHIIVMENLLSILLEHYTISEIENGKCTISIHETDIQKVIKRLEPKSN